MSHMQFSEIVKTAAVKCAYQIVFNRQQVNLLKHGDINLDYVVQIKFNKCQFCVVGEINIFQSVMLNMELA